LIGTKRNALAVIPQGLAKALGPVLQQIAAMSTKIKQYDRQIQQLNQTTYPETKRFEGPAPLVAVPAHDRRNMSLPSRLSSLNKCNITKCAEAPDEIPFYRLAHP
jgi:hypothetical protein